MPYICICTQVTLANISNTLTHLAKNAKLTPDEAKELLLAVGLSFRKIGKMISKSDSTVRNVLLQTGQGYYSKKTVEKVWQIIEEHQAKAEERLAQLRRAA